MLNQIPQNLSHLFYYLFTEMEYASMEILNWKSGGQGSPLAFATNLLTEEIAYNSSELLLSSSSEIIGYSRFPQTLKFSNSAIFLTGF